MWRLRKQPVSPAPDFDLHLAKFGYKVRSGVLFSTVLGAAGSEVDIDVLGLWDCSKENPTRRAKKVCPLDQPAKES